MYDSEFWKLLNPLLYIMKLCSNFNVLFLCKSCGIKHSDSPFSLYSFFKTKPLLQILRWFWQRLTLYWFLNLAAFIMGVMAAIAGYKSNSMVVTASRVCAAFAAFISCIVQGQTKGADAHVLNERLEIQNEELASGIGDLAHGRILIEDQSPGVEELDPGVENLVPVIKEQAPRMEEQAGIEDLSPANQEEVFRVEGQAFRIGEQAELKQRGRGRVHLTAAGHHLGGKRGGNWVSSTSNTKYRKIAEYVLCKHVKEFGQRM
ncbi:hypothetical protein F5050DRAFT_1710048 [Lentinula boryana]|uniref:SMODS and SLOG-associating 2TM effector domain-containing protein n=1 Tax=Lentinula boryana TaxID=40481 RepID=A0ABQ8QK91_9AGAR|nr:hypothetical protein F5050DRAFT_1710048 [Lentinula boryana]